MHQLYGDGIHDDYPAIQEMIDSGVCEVSLPAPKKFYLITKTLRIPSNFRLVLPRYAEIRLADGADCFMVTNRWTVDRAERLLQSNLGKYGEIMWGYVNEASPSPEHVCENIEIVGGIWNFNNMNQSPNPMLAHEHNKGRFSGMGMLFFNVKNFKLSSLTLKDPVTFAVTLDRASYFTVENITFDFNFGNPAAGNMDGIHINGNCHYGYLRNLKGACYDDLVALNAHEGSVGPITHMEIDGIFAEECHSAVRLLAVQEKVAHVHISNVYGTFYQYCIAFSRYYVGELEGFDDISIDHIYASKAVRLPHLYPFPDSYVFPLVWFEGGLRAKNVSVSALHRRECNVAVETFYVGENTEVDTLIIDDVTTENETGKPIPFLVNHGHIKNLVFRQIRTNGDEKLIDEGTIDCLTDR